MRVVSGQRDAVAEQRRGLAFFWIERSNQDKVSRMSGAYRFAFHLHAAIIDCTGAPGSAHRVIDDFYRGRAYELLKLEYRAEPRLRDAFEPAPRLAANPVKEPSPGAEPERIVLAGGMTG